MIPTRQILGLRFFNGDVDEAVAFMHRHGGYLVAPSGTCFARLREDETYRRAVLAADLAIADSGLMVGLWRLLRRQNVHRISGLKYLKHLLRNLKGAGNREVLWVLPTEAARRPKRIGPAFLESQVLVGFQPGTPASSRSDAHRQAGSQVQKNLDPIGVLLASGALFAVVFGLIEGQRYHWGTFTDVASFDAGGGHWGLFSIPSLFVASAILFVLFVLWDRVQEQPLVPLALFAERNFTIGNGLAAIVSFGMMGLFLPLTIFLQSVLGFSALKAGLTLAPLPLTSMLVAPLSGRATDRFGGKYILMAGLAFFGVGMGLVIVLSSLNTGQFTYLPALILAGVGLGCTFAPMTTVTMQRVNPRLAGAASGLLNTNRQLGGAFGSAVVGAILQNRLASELVSQAQVQAASLPPAFRAPFVQDFARAANSALQVGRGQSGVSLPSNLPPALRSRVLQIGHDVFAQAFINAMRPSLAIAIAVLLFGALLTSGLEIRRRASSQRLPEAAPAAG